MKNILVVTGSVRVERAADRILELVKKELVGRDDVEVTVADLRELKLPLFDAPVPPSNEAFEIRYDNVKQWQNLVKRADGVILITPEYNASTSAALKNAIDWLYSEWQNKPVTVVGYGWHGAASARRHLSDILERLRAVEVTPATGLTFTSTINMDGSALDEVEVGKQLTATLDALFACLEDGVWK